MSAFIEDVLLELEGKERLLADLVAIVLFFIFLFVALRGYKFFKLVAGIETAALLFIVLGFLDWHPAVCVILAIFLGCIVYAYYEKLLTGIVFLISGLLALIITGILSDMNTPLSVVVAICVAFLSAFLVYKFTKPFIIIYTSIQFGFLCGTMVNYVFNEPFDQFKIIMQISFSVLAIVMQIKKYGFIKDNNTNASDFSWKESLSKLEDVNANPQITVIKKEASEESSLPSAGTAGEAMTIPSVTVPGEATVDVPVDVSGEATVDVPVVNSAAAMEEAMVEATVAAKVTNAAAATVEGPIEATAETGSSNSRHLSKKQITVLLSILAALILIIASVLVIKAVSGRNNNLNIQPAIEPKYNDADSEDADSNGADSCEADYDSLFQYAIQNGETMVDSAYIKSDGKTYVFATLMPEEPDFLLPYVDIKINSYFEVAFYDGSDWTVLDKESLLNEEDPYDGYYEEVSSYGTFTFEDEQHYYVEVYGMDEYAVKYVYGVIDQKPQLLLSDVSIYQTENGTFCRTWGESGILNVEVGFDGEKYIQYSSEIVSDEKMEKEFKNFNEINTDNLNELYNQKTIYIEGWDECNIDSVSYADLIDVRHSTNDKYYLTYEYDFYASYAADESYEINQVFYYTYRADGNKLIREEGDEFVNYARKQEASSLNLPIK